MDPAFLQALRGTKRPRVFRLGLKPFTLGHLFLLHEIASPLVDPDESEVTFADIGAAVFVCSQSPSDAKAGFLKWWFTPFLWFWSRFATDRWFSEDLPAFRQYLNDSTDSPGIRPAIRDGGSSRECMSPGPMVKLFFAMHILGLNRDEAMAMEVIEINALYATWAEWSGNGELVDGSQMNALFDFARQQDALRFNPDGSRRNPENN
jgi:hypothetical protein